MGKCKEFVALSTTSGTEIVWRFNEPSCFQFDWVLAAAKEP